MLTALLALLLAPLAPAPTAGLWVEPSLPPAVPLATIRQWLDSAGLQPVELGSQQLLDPSALAPERLRLLVLPYA
ncbi:MAG: hypothetical protein HUU35_16825, partial [Armatimonadetes bacterium]|nr:hypothetical protein [Armatimonadota bacterium]